MRDAAADLVHVVLDALEFERDFVGGYEGVWYWRWRGGCRRRLVDYDWTVLVRGSVGALEWVGEFHHVRLWFLYLFRDLGWVGMEEDLDGAGVAKPRWCRFQS
jgi:hypothetical protein